VREILTFFKNFLSQIHIWDDFEWMNAMQRNIVYKSWAKMVAERKKTL